MQANRGQTPAMRRVISTALWWGWFHHVTVWTTAVSSNLTSASPPAGITYHQHQSLPCNGMAALPAPLPRAKSVPSLRVSSQPCQICGQRATRRDAMMSAPV